MKHLPSKLDAFKSAVLPHPEQIKGGDDSTNIIIIDESTG